MTGKEKFKLTFNHEEGPVLLDIGGMPTTGIHCTMVEKLRDYYGLEKRPVTILEPMQMLGLVEDDLKEAMGIQTTPLWGSGTMFGFKQKNFREYKTPWNQVVLVSDEFITTTNHKGDTLIYPCGDDSCEPCACMPDGAYYFDAINRAPEFDEDNYNVEDNFEEFGPISDEELKYLEEEALKVKDSGNVILGNLGGTAIGDIALVPGIQLKHPKGIRDVEEWYVSTLTRQEELHEIFAYQTKYALENLEKMHKVIGDSIQIAYICGNDLGTQHGPFCSSESFNNLYAPYYRQINGWIHEHTNWKTFKHSCGSIYDLLPNLIDVGFDIINPVQWTAKDMEKERLKAQYGDYVVFWGGGVDTQKVLPFGTPKEVREQVLECCKVFSKNGGFVFNTIHNIQPLVPIENLIAMINAVHEFNGER